MIDLVLGEIKGKTKLPVLFTLPADEHADRIWSMIDSICDDGELVAISVSVPEEGFKETEFTWPATIECLEKSLSRHITPEGLSGEAVDGRVITSYHSPVGEFFYSKEEQSSPLPNIKIEKCSKSMLCISLSLFGRSLTLGWRT